MTLLWILSGAALVMAILAWRAARNAARRLDQLTQMLWALKYQHGELRSQLLQPPPSTPGGLDEAPDRASGGPAASPADGFVPLSSLRR